MCKRTARELMSADRFRNDEALTAEVNLLRLPLFVPTIALFAFFPNFEYVTVGVSAELQLHNEGSRRAG